MRVNRLFQWTQDHYRNLLNVLLDHNGKVLFVAAFVALLAAPFFLLSQKELAPREDQGSIMVAVTAPPEAPQDYTERYMYEVVDAMLAVPGSTLMWQVIFANGGFGGMQFVDYSERDQSVHELIPIAFRNLSQIEGLTAAAAVEFRAANRGGAWTSSWW